MAKGLNNTSHSIKIMIIVSSCLRSIAGNFIIRKCEILKQSRFHFTLLELFIIKDCRKSWQGSVCVCLPDLAVLKDTLCTVLGFH